MSFISNIQMHVANARIRKEAKQRELPLYKKSDKDIFFHEQYDDFSEAHEKSFISKVMSEMRYNMRQILIAGAAILVLCFTLGGKTSESINFLEKRSYSNATK